MATATPVPAPPSAELVPAPQTAVIDRGLHLATSEVIQRTRQIRDVMEKVMKKDVHYGVIPGTQKPTMYQPGADVLNVTFRIAPIISLVDDLSTEDEIRYRITVRGEHQVTKETLAEGIGECSSSEEKYRWRRPVCDEEFNEAPENRRRNKWAKGQGGKAYKQKQIRTSPTDVANTVLKMAVKRAKIAMTLNATAASDVFGQDLEDLAEELRESLAEEGVVTELPKPTPRVSEQKATNGTAAPPAQQPPAPPAQQQAPPPKPASAPPAPPKPATSKSVGTIAKVDTFGNAIKVTLDTGFFCATTEPDHIQSIGRLQDQKRKIELITRPSARGADFAPILVGIEFPADDDPAVQS